MIFVVVTVYAANTFLGKPNFEVRFLHFYLNDMFAMPLVLAYVNLLILWFGNHSWRITTPVRIACLTAFCVIVWEGFAPMVLANSKRDLFDIVAYSTGSFGYYVTVLASRCYR